MWRRWSWYQENKIKCEKAAYFWAFSEVRKINVQLRIRCAWIFFKEEGEWVNLQERAKEVVVDNNVIAKSADFVATGIRAVDFVKLCNVGFLNRVRHGYYQLAEQSVSLEVQLLTTLISKGIICVESALFHYVMFIATLRHENGQ